MDYLVFLTGLFLVASALGCLLICREDRRWSRWPQLALALAALGLNVWYDILVFATDKGGPAVIVHAVLQAVSAMVMLGFCLSPLDGGKRTAFALKWVALIGVFAITLTCTISNPTCGMIVIVGVAFAAGWQLSGFHNALLGRKKATRPLVTALLVSAITTICVVPESVAICHDSVGQGHSPERIAFLVTLACAMVCSIALCAILWAAPYQKNRDRLSPNLRRRRKLGTSMIVAAAVITFTNGAWLTRWLGNQAQQEQTSILLSALHLGANNLDPGQIEQIEGKPEEISGRTFIQLRNNLLDIRAALPGNRFTFLLGARNKQLVFLVDAENPANKEDFSAPGDPVRDQPEKWQPALAGKATFLGPYRDAWGVWFSAVVPVRNSDRQVVALLSVDYPAAKWLQPLAARRLSAMVVLLSVAVLLIVLFGFHLTSIEASRRVESLSEHLSDAMEAVPSGLAVVSAGGVVTYANPAFIRLARGDAAESLVGKALDSLISNTAAEPEADQGFEAAFTCLDGTSVPIQVFRADLSESPEEKSSILAIVDLTAAKEAEQNLLRSRADANRLAVVAKRTDNAVVITDAAGRIEWVNEGFSRISGYGKEEVIGKKPGDFLQRPGHDTDERTYMSERIQAGMGFETEITNFAKNGRAYIIHIECQPLADKNGKLTGFMAIERDITQTRRSANLLEAVAATSSMLLSTRFEPSVWGKILTSLGAAANADRCYIFQIHPHPKLGTPAMSQTAEWNSGAATPQIQNLKLQNFSFHENGYGRWLGELLAGHEISGTVKDFPLEEQPMIVAQEIRSLVVVPIFTGDQLSGFMGFDACHEDRIWENWEISILRSAAANIGLRQVVQNEADALVLARDEAHQAALAAETANRAKSTFLATMSHEIRTPLNAIIGMASLLETTSLNTQQKDFAETILNSSNFLLTLINDILDYSRIESGIVYLDSAPFTLADVCRDAFEVVRLGTMGKDIELIARVAPHLPIRIVGDSTRLSQILVNLLSNAVKFTSAGFISLIADGHPGAHGRWHLTFEVKDSGIGIAAEAIPNLFQPFVQEDSSTTRRFGGTGLGLAISKRLASAMGGDITVNSASGQGSTFFASLTLNAAADPVAITTPAFTHFPPTAHLKILIVDDNNLNRRILEEMLANWGLPCHCASSGLQAIHQWNQSGPYDLVIADHHMPDMNGVEMTRTLRALPNAANTRFALLSSDSHQLAEARAIFDDVGAKPIWPAAILATLTRLFPHTAAEVAPTLNPANPGESERLANLSILVAEDNPNNQKVISLLLKRLGIEPVLVDDGRQAVEAARASAYDIILLDLQMPVMDGLQASREIRALPQAKRPFIIALTANAFQEDRDAAKAAGMDDYLSKPITLDRLRAMLASFPAPGAVISNR